MKHLDTVVIGAGQAGLAISYYLTQAGREHVVLEKERMAKARRDERWDSFTLVTPNWTLGLPGMEYEGDDPDGFLTRREVVDYLERFAERFDPPILEGVEATAVEAAPGSDDLIVRSSAGDYRAANAVVAPGMFQRPRIPALSGRLPDRRQRTGSRSGCAARDMLSPPSGSIALEAWAEQPGRHAVCSRGVATGGE